MRAGASRGARRRRLGHEHRPLVCARPVGDDATRSWRSAEPLAERAAPLYASHIRNESDELLAAVEEALAIGETLGVPVEVSHLKAAGRRNFGRTRDALGLIAGGAGPRRPGHLRHVPVRGRQHVPEPALPAVGLRRRHRADARADPLARRPPPDPPRHRARAAGVGQPPARRRRLGPDPRQRDRGAGGRAGRRGRFVSDLAAETGQGRPRPRLRPAPGRPRRDHDGDLHDVDRRRPRGARVADLAASVRTSTRSPARTSRTTRAASAPSRGCSAVVARWPRCRSRRRSGR